MKLQLWLLIILGLIIIPITYATPTKPFAPTIDECFTLNFTDICLKNARPESFTDCNKIPSNLTNYSEAITNCYAAATKFDSKACDKLLLEQEFKDLCYYQSNNCKKIVDTNIKSKCEDINKKYSTAPYIILQIIKYIIFIFAIILLVLTAINIIKKGISTKQIIMIIAYMLIAIVMSIILFS